MTRQSSTPKKVSVITFRGKELHLDLRAKHARGVRGWKAKKASLKEVVDYDDDKEEDEEVKSSISDILEGLYINDDEDVEDTNAGK